MVANSLFITGKLDRRTRIWTKETGGSTTEWTRGTPEKRYIYREEPDSIDDKSTLDAISREGRGCVPG